MTIRLPPIHCPGCDKPFEPELPSQVATHLPPIDLDGWTSVGCQENLACPHCGEVLELNVSRTLAGTEPSVSSIDFADLKMFKVDTLLWSPSGKMLAICTSKSFRIFKIDLNGCDLLEYSGSTQAPGWDGEQFVTFAYDGPGGQIQYRTTSYLPRRKQSKWLYPFTHWNFDIAWAAGGARSAVGGYRLESVPHVEIRDMKSDRVCRQDVLAGKSGGAKFWFNLTGNAVLAARLKPCADSNSLELWRFNLEAQSMEMAGAYSALNTRIEWAGWDNEGNILAAELEELHQKKRAAKVRALPYGLVRFSGKDLTLLQHEKHLDPPLCPEGVALKHVQPLPNGQIVWCTDNLYLLDTDTWKCTKTFPVKIESDSCVATSPNGDMTAISTAKAVLIYDHATNALISVRRGKATK